MNASRSEVRAPNLATLLDLMRDAGVEALVLNPGPVVSKGPTAIEYRPIQLLVRAADFARARAVLEPLDWRYSWLRGKLLRLLPAATYWWDSGPVIEVYWSLPAAPLPPAALSRLTNLVWQHAERSAVGHLRPDAATRLVHLAVQACRPGRGHEGEWADFLELHPSVGERSRVERAAQAAGVGRALQRAVAAADAGSSIRPGPGPLYDGPRDLAWRLAAALQGRAYPRRLRRLLAGAPAYGDAAIRCRIAGIELRAGPGVFVPAPEAELFVDAAVARIAALARPTIVEMGTGCGPIALALARARPDAEVHGAELSSVAVRWAKSNARRLGLDRVRFHRGSLLDPLPHRLRGRVDLMIANLPYVPAREDFTIGSLPRATIQGSGDDGLGLVRQLARGARRFLSSGGRLQLQMLAWQWDLLAPELATLGYRPGPPQLFGSFAICPADLAAPAAGAH